MATFPERLKELRTAKKLTQKELAEQIGIQQGSYTNWENGKREPNYDNLIKLSMILEASTDYILGVSNINTGSGYSKIPELVPSYIIENLLDDLEKTKDSFSEKEYTSKKSNFLKLLDSWNEFNDSINGNNLETTRSKSNKIDDNEKY